MDLGESIFRYWLKFKKKHLEGNVNEELISITLKEMSDRLRYLGLLLSGSLHEMHGGSQKEEFRDFLVFPDIVSELPTREENIDLMIFRLVFYLTGIEIGIRIPAEVSYAEQFLFNILKSEEVVKAMKERYPGISALSDYLYEAVLRTRPNVYKMKSLADVLEHLAQLRLKRNDVLPDELKFLSELWERPDNNVMAKKDLSLIINNISAIYPAKTLPKPLWLWGFTAHYKPQSEISEMPELSRREGKKISFDLNRTVHLKKWKEAKKESNPLFHSFEKTESVEDYGGENIADAIEDMTEDEEAMNDLTLGTVIRTTEMTRGLLKADVIDEGTEITVEKKSNNSPGQIFNYPEWDYRSKIYRKDWCTLYEVEQKVDSLRTDNIEKGIIQRRKREIQEIRTSIIKHLSSRKARNRQLDGPEIDHDAVVERYADVSSGHSPTERLYITQRKAIKDISFLVLLDTSLSTDGYIDGRRILDIEIESSLILAGAFEGFLDDEVAVAHFNSRTRNDCRFTYLKRFNRSWSSLRKVAPYLEPDGYTRIGPAIRHAIKALAQTKARKKFLILVSDGKPSDYDQYEGRYGVRDVAQAIREARQQAITTFGLAVEHQSKARLSEMFGHGRYHVLPKSSLLPAYMADIFLRAIF